MISVKPNMPAYKKSSKPIISVIVLLNVAGVFTGCQTVIPEKSPEITVTIPVKWNVENSVQSGSEVAYQWVSGFGDERLKQLVDEALKNSPDLKLAYARMESSMHLARMARSERYPSVSLDLEGSNTETNIRDFNTINTEQYRLSVGAAWELDLWGKIRNSSAASVADWEASTFDLQQAKHSIAASVSQAWFNLVAASQQLDLAQETVRSYSATADLIQTRYESGIDSALDYRLAVANSEGAKSSLARRKELFKRSQRSLQMLLGRYPDGKLLAGVNFPFLGDQVPAGLPSKLLNRRPDVRSTERRLASSEALVKVASHQRLPSIQMTGSTGTQTSDFKNLMDGDFEFWSVGASVSQPLFTGGRLIANHERARAVFEQNRALYEQVALQAFNEVEQALDADKYFEEQERALKSASEQSIEAEKLAWDQYTSGTLSIVTVLEAQRRALTAKQSYIDSRNSRIQNRIRLYLALGGDF